MKISPLHLATEYNNVEMIKLLIKGGFDVNIQNNLGQTPLLFACYHNFYESVDVLLKYGANPNIICGSNAWFYFTKTALGLAIRYGNFDIVELLLKFGADPNLEFYCYKGTHYLLQLLYSGYKRISITKVIYLFQVLLDAGLIIPENAKLDPQLTPIATRYNLYKNSIEKATNTIPNKYIFKHIKEFHILLLISINTNKMEIPIPKELVLKIAGLLFY